MARHKITPRRGAQLSTPFITHHRNSPLRNSPHRPVVVPSSIPRDSGRTTDHNTHSAHPTRNSSSSTTTTTNTSTTETTPTNLPQPVEVGVTAGTSGTSTQASETQDVVPKGNETRNSKKRKSSLTNEEAPQKKVKKQYLRPNSNEDAPAKRGVKEESKLTVVLTRRDGTKETHHYNPRAIKDFKNSDFNWDDPQQIRKINAWRQQKYRRAAGLKRPTRERWTLYEERKLYKAVEKELHRVKCEKNMKWSNVKGHLDHSLTSKTRKKGQEYASSTIAKKPSSSADKVQKGRKPMSNFVKKSGSYPTRSIASIKNQAHKFASLDVLWTRRIPEHWVLNEEELNQTSEGESDEEDIEGDDDKDSDDGSNLEEDSDEEEDGMRPAANGNEGTPVCAV